jgi:hypothetical protein
VYKRPVGQNLFDFYKSGGDFEVKISGCITVRRGSDLEKNKF